MSASSPHPPVPLADEIRAVRAAVRRAELASIELAQIEVAIALLERGLPLDASWVGSFAERWPELAVVPTDRTLLLAVRGALAPIARDLIPKSHRLHDLQHEQRDRLAAPELAALRAELDAAVAELHDRSTRRTAPMQRAGALGPALAVAERAVRDAASGSAARVAALAEALVASVSPILEVVGLDPLPTADTPSAQIDTVVEHLRAHHDRARAEADLAEAAYRALNEALLERMG